MIFATVGTHHDPFSRLLSALEDLDEDFVVQYGPGQRPPNAVTAEAFMPFDEMLKWFKRADVVITHAGVGSIICATRAGHVPVVVPRRKEFGEHVDDHQSELVRALAEFESVIPVWDVDELASSVDASRNAKAAHQGASRAELSSAVSVAMRGD